jgi:hypothetical protein
MAFDKALHSWYILKLTMDMSKIVARQTKIETISCLRCVTASKLTNDLAVCHSEK